MLEVIGRLGQFFLRLKIDELRGTTEDIAVVKERSAQLRCACSAGTRVINLWLIQARIVVCR